MEETRKSGRNEERERKKGNRSEKGRNKRKIGAMMGKKRKWETNKDEFID